jgi:hypothetical protein
MTVISLRVFQLKIDSTLQRNKAVLSALEKGLPAGQSRTLRPKRSAAAAHKVIGETVEDLMKKLSAERTKKKARKQR